ncbi:hypothetical protein O988_04442 [Pseudogymnoascus sp. VKM F-3808]|nr:hypothetical protein O988_04442 [Pseudogymnoascus sp. VKM F-3808]
MRASANATMTDDNESTRVFAHTIPEEALVNESQRRHALMFPYPSDHPVVFVKCGGPEKQAEEEIQRLALNWLLRRMPLPVDLVGPVSKELQDHLNRVARLGCHTNPNPPQAILEKELVFCYTDFNDQNFMFTTDADHCPQRLYIVDFEHTSFLLHTEDWACEETPAAPSYPSSPVSCASTPQPSTAPPPTRPTNTPPPAPAYQSLKHLVLPTYAAAGLRACAPQQRTHTQLDADPTRRGHVIGRTLRGVGTTWSGRMLCHAATRRCDACSGLGNQAQDPGGEGGDSRKRGSVLEGRGMRRWSQCGDGEARRVEGDRSSGGGVRRSRHVSPRVPESRPKVSNGASGVAKRRDPHALMQSCAKRETHANPTFPVISARRSKTRSPLGSGNGARGKDAALAALSVY